MSIPALLLGNILVALGIFMVIKARKKMTALKKYEFENRTADGVVEFASIDLSRVHAADKGLYTVIGIVGFFVGLFGVALLVAGVNRGCAPHHETRVVETYYFCPLQIGLDNDAPPNTV